MCLFWRKSKAPSSNGATDGSWNTLKNRPAQDCTAKSNGDVVGEKLVKDTYRDAYGSPERELLSGGANENVGATRVATAVREFNSDSDGGENDSARVNNGSGGANEEKKIESLPHRRAVPSRSRATSSAPVTRESKPKEVERMHSEGAWKTRVAIQGSGEMSATTGTGTGPGPSTSTVATAALAPLTAAATAGGAEKEQMRNCREGEEEGQEENDGAGRGRQGEEDGSGGSAVELSLAQLSRMCDGFARWRMVGSGKTGTVYRGISEQLGDVAVKELNEEMRKDWDLWLPHVHVLYGLHHPSVARLLAYGREGDRCFHVYKYYHGGSLQEAMFKANKLSSKASKSGPVLAWHRRLTIAVQVAQGLAYLHQRSVIHRYLKPSNILLDEDGRAVVGDVAMAKGSMDADHISTRVMGSMGYLDPTYLETGHLRASSDVYSFGVILLELLTGREAVTEDCNREPLLSWAWPLFTAEKNRPAIDQLLDSRMTVEANRDVAMVVAIIAKRCLAPTESQRPPMEQVAEKLKMAETKQLTLMGRVA